MESAQALLLVEGPDDKHVVEKLFHHHGVTDFKVEDKSGCDQLLKELPVILKGSAQQHIGIVIDADTNEDMLSRWHRICSILQKAGYQSVPETPAAPGTLVFEVGKPSIGVWLMPDNSTAGKLEDFVATLIPEADSCWPIAVEVIDRLQGPVRQFRDVDAPKARIHTWLAWQANPGAKMGAAITQKYLDPNRDSAIAFVTWARQITIAPKTLSD